MVVGDNCHGKQQCAKNHGKNNRSSQDFDGFKFPTKRRVLPLLIGKRPLTGPVIVAIDIHELRFFSSADK